MSLDCRVIDLWDQLQEMFVVAGEEEYPEIDVTALTVDGTRDIIRYVMDRSRELSATFMLPGTRHKIWPTSADVASRRLAEGSLVGVLWSRMSPMPSLGVFFDGPGRLSVAFAPGRHWSPIAVMGMFDLLRQVHLLSPGAQVSLDPLFFTASQRSVFNIVLREYLNELV